jgi:putative ABC transport system permease protein
MKTLRTLRISIRGIFAHKVKATLAVISIAGGVAAVIITGAIGDGASERVLHETQAMGTNLLVVRPTQIQTSAARPGMSGVVTTLTLDDYRAIADLPSVGRAAPGFEDLETAKAGDTAASAMVLGTTPPYLDVASFSIQFGRFVTDYDNAGSRRVAVLGARINQLLFGGQDSVGKQIMIGDVPFEVVGVLKAKGVLADGSDEDDRIVIPIRTALRRVFNISWLNPIFVSVDNVAQMDQVRMEIAELLRIRHRLIELHEPDDFSIQDKTKVLETQRNLAETLTLLATGLAMASLVVGGLGVLALMLMSVKERTTEIGLRIAVGARSRDILVQFLLESTGLSAGGWLIGAILGIVAALVVGRVTTWNVAISPKLLMITLGVMAGSGLVFGAYPARKASLMMPITALRTE